MCLFDCISFYAVSLCGVYSFLVSLLLANSSSYVCWGRASILRLGSSPPDPEVTIHTPFTLRILVKPRNVYSRRLNLPQ